MIPFTYEGTPMRTVVVESEPWFVSMDALDILGLHRSSLTALDDDEKGVHTVDTLGGVQRVGIISEPGLYSLILRSRKPEAKAFKRWITHEVLPSPVTISKTPKVTGKGQTYLVNHYLKEMAK
jgi:prophage antirepressor-like protein